MTLGHKQILSMDFQMDIKWSRRLMVIYVLGGDPVWWGELLCFPDMLNGLEKILNINLM